MRLSLKFHGQSVSFHDYLEGQFLVYCLFFKEHPVTFWRQVMLLFSGLFLRDLYALCLGRFEAYIFILQKNTIVNEYKPIFQDQLALSFDHKSLSIIDQIINLKMKRTQSRKWNPHELATQRKSIKELKINKVGLSPFLACSQNLVTKEKCILCGVEYNEQEGTTVIFDEENLLSSGSGCSSSVENNNAGKEKQGEDVFLMGMMLPQLGMDVSLGKIYVAAGKYLELQYSQIQNIQFTDVKLSFITKRLCLTYHGHPIKCYKVSSLPYYLLSLYKYCCFIIQTLSQNFTNPLNTNPNPEEHSPTSTPKSTPTIIKSLQQIVYQFKYRSQKQQKTSVQLKIEGKQFLMKVRSEGEVDVFEYEGLQEVLDGLWRVERLREERDMRRKIVQMCTKYWFENIGDI